MAETEQSFEAMTKELEDILLILERGERPLEEMLRLYGRGVELIGLCRTKLNVAEETLQAGTATPAPPDEAEPDEQNGAVGAGNHDTLF